jgi:hypothetical protein
MSEMMADAVSDADGPIERKKAIPQSPLVRHLKREKLPHLSAELRWDGSDGSDDFGSSGRPRATMALPDVGSEDDDAFFRDEYDYEMDGREVSEEVAGVAFAPAADMTQYFSASDVPSDGAVNKVVVESDSDVQTAAATSGVSITLGRRSTQYLVMVRRGHQGGKHFPHLFMMERRNSDGYFYFANGESYGTVNEAMLRYTLSEDAKLCTELGCMFHGSGPHAH